MPFLLLICLMTVCLPIEWPAPPFGIGQTGSAVCVGGMALMLLIGAGWVGLGTARRLEKTPQLRESIGQRYTTARTYLFFANLIGFGVCLIGLGWAWAATRYATISFEDRSVSRASLAERRSCFRDVIDDANGAEGTE